MKKRLLLLVTLVLALFCAGMSDGNGIRAELAMQSAYAANEDGGGLPDCNDYRASVNYRVGAWVCRWVGFGDGSEWLYQPSG